MSMKYYDCVCILALVNRHTMRMRRVLLSSVACLSLPHFPSLSHRRNDFPIYILENHSVYLYIEYKIYVLIFSATVVRNFFILRRIQRHIIINAHRSSCTVLFILLRF